MPYAKVRDINMYYEVYGSGFPLVMIMGLGANTYWWDPYLIDEFSKHFKVVVFDNRGAGRTDKPAVDYTMKMFADDTVGLMDYLGIKKAHILGVSMGGMIAQEIALNYPERVEKLVLCVTAPGGRVTVPPKPEAMALLTMDRSKLTDEQIAMETIKVLYPKEFIEKHPEIVKVSLERLSKYVIPTDAFMRQINAILKFDAYDRLSHINKPTLVVSGGKDILVPPENGKLIAEKIPNAKLVIFEESGHGLITQERERFASLVIDFLKK
ncbi:MAG: alpha/beta fold hydrolase [Candidatus Jordarchaeales archaeon]